MGNGDGAKGKEEGLRRVKVNIKNIYFFLTIITEQINELSFEKRLIAQRQTQTL